VKRREFITLLGGTAVAWPLAARGQHIGRPARVGLFASDPENPVMGPASAAFLDELRKLGFTDGQNLIVDRKSTAQHLDALVTQALEMARASSDVLVALGSETTLQACARASQSIPIVFVANNYDPIARGYVNSLRRPGGNVTGVFLRQTELAQKQVEILKEALPDRTRLAVLWDAISADQFEAAEQRAKLLQLVVHSHKMENPPYDIPAAFRSIADLRADMLLVLSSQFIARHRDQLAAHAIGERIPTMFIFKAYVQAGGLLSYGVDDVAMYRHGATFVSRILRGAKPADLPVELPTKYEMSVNLKTAKAIGVELPTSILLRADEVIE
jgi:putative ABC transport system substrate-binding protein